MKSVAVKWLKALKLPVETNYFEKQLLSHPEFPSLLSLTDTLDSLGIRNFALQVDSQNVYDIPLPFLAHTIEGTREELVLIKKRSQVTGTFLKQWDGIAVVIDKDNTQLPAENKKALLEARSRFMLSSASILLFIVSIGISLAIDFSAKLCAVFLTTLAGLIISLVIKQHQYGNGGSLVEKLCSAGKVSDCGAVLRSKVSKLPLGMTVSDLCVFYFAGFLLIACVGIYSVSAPSFIPVLSLLSAIAFPVSIISIVYQKFFIKKWCPLCLAISAMIWVNFGLVAPDLSTYEFNWPVLLTAISVFSIVAFAWVSIAELMKRTETQMKEARGLTHFKRNFELFGTLLSQQRSVDITPFENEILLGNPSAPVQLLMVCSPYCGPCAFAHTELHEICKIYGEKIGLTIRFVVNKPKESEDDITKVVSRLMRSIFETESTVKNAHHVLHSWFSTMDIAQLPPVKNSARLDKKIEELMIQHAEWCKKSNIRFTPTLFINGIELPKFYQIKDLHFLMNGLLVMADNAAPQLLSEKY